MAYVVGAKTLNGAKKYAEYLRRNANGNGKGSADVEHRLLGGAGGDGAVTINNNGYFCKIVSYVSDFMYNVEVYTSKTGTKVADGVLVMAVSQIPSTQLAAGTWVTGVPHILTGVPATGGV